MIFATSEQGFFSVHGLTTDDVNLIREALIQKAARTRLAGYTTQANDLDTLVSNIAAAVINPLPTELDSKGICE